MSHFEKPFVCLNYKRPYKGRFPVKKQKRQKRRHVGRLPLWFEITWCVGLCLVGCFYGFVGFLFLMR